MLDLRKVDYSIELTVGEQTNPSVFCSGWKAGLLSAVGGGAHRGLWRTAGEEQFQEADESLCAFLPKHWTKHDLSPLPGGVRLDESGTNPQLSSFENCSIQCISHLSLIIIFDVDCFCVSHYSFTGFYRCLFLLWSFLTMVPLSWLVWRTAGMSQHR